LNAFRNTSPRSEAVLDIFLSQDLQSHTMIGGENRHNDARSAIAGKNEILISQARFRKESKKADFNIVKICLDF
jgi:hypothetical protein